MINIIKNRTFWLVTALLVVSGLSLYQCNTSNNLKQKAKDYKTLYFKEQKALTVWKDEHNKWRAKAEATEISNRTLKELARNNDKNMMQIRDEFSGLKNNLRNLDTYVKTVIKDTLYFKSTLTDTLWISANGDTVKGKKGIYKDSWSNCVGLIYNDTLNVNCTTTDSITTVVYWNRKWFLGRKTYFVEHKNANPNNKPVYNENLIIRKKR